VLDGAVISWAAQCTVFRGARTYRERLTRHRKCRVRHREGRTRHREGRVRYQIRAHAWAL